MVGAGSPVVAGSLNLDGPLTVRITAAGSDTTLAEIARMMDAAGQSRSRYVRIADRAARLYAPAVHSLALLAFAGWMLAGAGWHQALLVSVAVLIITCPCALGLAVPAAQVVAAGALMRRGILLKDGSALERMAEADTVRFDKTGTLTLGRPELADALPLAGDAARAALALTLASRHPLAKALMAALTGAGVPPAAIDDVREEPGRGVSARWGGRSVRLGSPEWLGIAVPPHADLVTGFELEGAPPVLLRFTDPLRPDAAAAVAALRAQGMGTAILSGDRTEAVAPVAAALEMPFDAGLKPLEKLAAIEALHGAGHRVLMVGDGLNDGPALAAGHVSVAPASASDVGQTAADYVFMGGGLMPVAIAVRAARRTLRVVRQNFGLAIGYNILAVPLALAGQVTPLIAAIAMSCSSLLVVGNALRLRGCAR